VAIKDLKIQRRFPNKNAKGNRKCARSTSQRNKKYVKYISSQYRKPLTFIFKRDFNSKAERRLERIQ